MAGYFFKISIPFFYKKINKKIKIISLMIILLSIIYLYYILYLIDN